MEILSSKFRATLIIGPNLELFLADLINCVINGTFFSTFWEICEIDLFLEIFFPLFGQFVKMILFWKLFFQFKAHFHFFKWQKWNKYFQFSKWHFWNKFYIFTKKDSNSVNPSISASHHCARGAMTNDCSLLPLCCSFAFLQKQIKCGSQSSIISLPKLSLLSWRSGLRR